MSSRSVQHPSESWLVASKIQQPKTSSRASLPSKSLSFRVLLSYSTLVSVQTDAWQYHLADQSKEWKESLARYVPADSKHFAAYSDKLATPKGPASATRQVWYQRPTGVGLTAAIASDLEPTLK
jgi:hypothetical protein